MNNAAICVWKMYSTSLLFFPVFSFIPSFFFCYDKNQITIDKKFSLLRPYCVTSLSMVRVLCKYGMLYLISIFYPTLPLTTIA